MRVSKPPEERRAELIDAARLLFDKYGVRNTRVSDIVASVGVAQGVFYYYFPSKDEMVQVVLHQARLEAEEQVAQLIDAPVPFCEKLARLIHLYIGLIDQFLGDEELNLQSLENAEADNPLASGMQELLRDTLVRLVLEGKANGFVQTDWPEETALTLLYGLRRLAIDRIPARRVVFSICETALGLPKGELVQYADQHNKGDMKHDPTK